MNWFAGETSLRVILHCMRMSEEDPVIIEISNREEFEKLTEMGTYYPKGGDESVVATVVGATEQRVNFVCTDA